MGYEIYPPCIHDVLIHCQENHEPRAIDIAESAMATGPEVVVDGAVVDLQRAEYYVDHLAEMKRAVDKAVRVRGYFARTLIDNFEWASLYTVPFGIAHVDFATQERWVKCSAEVYREGIRARR